MGGRLKFSLYVTIAGFASLPAQHEPFRSTMRACFRLGALNRAKPATRFFRGGLLSKKSSVDKPENAGCGVRHVCRPRPRPADFSVIQQRFIQLSGRYAIDLRGHLRSLDQCDAEPQCGGHCRCHQQRGDRREAVRSTIEFRLVGIRRKRAE